MTQKEILHKMHQLELYIALEIRRICEKNNISYFLIYGTLLGAVRHGGFIPWDDDMDIGMLRPDYENFLKACEEDLGEEFYLQTWDTDKNYPFSFAKIRLNHTQFVETFAETTDTNNGIFVDIFPYDHVPENYFASRLQAARYFVCKRLLWIKKGMGQNLKQNIRQAVRYYIFWSVSHLFSYEAIKRYYKKALQKYNAFPADKVAANGAYSFKKESIKKSWTENLEQVLFEGERFMAFKDRNAYLEYIYGDYKKLPPVSQRGGHLVRKVDFGPYG